MDLLPYLRRIVLETGMRPQSRFESDVRHYKPLFQESHKEMTAKVAYYFNPSSLAGPKATASKHQSKQTTTKKSNSITPPSQYSGPFSSKKKPRSSSKNLVQTSSLPVEIQQQR